MYLKSYHGFNKKKNGGGRDVNETIAANQSKRKRRTKSLLVKILIMISEALVPVRGCEMGYRYFRVHAWYCGWKA